MKTKVQIIGAALALLVTSSLAANAQDSRYSTKPWVAFGKIASANDFHAVPPEAQIAMACAKCKSIVVSYKRDLTTKPGHGTTDELMVVDQCPGCGGKMAVRGDKQTQMVHTCSKCGEDSAFCCATGPGANPTRGMEKK